MTTSESTREAAKVKERKPFNASIELRRAHDVRQVRPCSLCAGIGSKRHMVREGTAFSHGRCFVAAHGIEALLRVPWATIGTLTLEDIGPDVMGVLLERHSRE